MLVDGFARLAEDGGGSRYLRIVAGICIFILQMLIFLRMEMNWIDGFRIEVALQGGAVVVSANREGLLSLANHLQALCEEPARGAHFHLDATTALEDGSLELIVERVE